MDPQGTTETVHRLLTTANLQRMRGNLAEAARACELVIEADPENATAHDLLGDLLAAQGQLQPALEHYQRAFKQEGRAATEEKIARLVLRLDAEKRSGTPDAGDTLSPVPQRKRNPSVATALSMFFPGLGQLYNNEVTKGFVFFGAWLIGSLLSAALALPHLRAIVGAASGRGGGPAIPGMLLFLALVMGAVWVYSIVDASLTATAINRGGREKSGWEI